MFIAMNKNKLGLDKPIISKWRIHSISDGTYDE